MHGVLDVGLTLVRHGAADDGVLWKVDGSNGKVSTLGVDMCAH